MSRRRAWIIVLLVVAALVALVNLPGRAPQVPKGMPPCVFEDAPGPCYWDAGSFGNGVGRSFWVDAEQTVHYLP